MAQLPIVAVAGHFDVQNMLRMHAYPFLCLQSSARLKLCLQSYCVEYMPWVLYHIEVWSSQHAFHFDIPLVLLQ